MKTDFFQSCGHCWVFQVCWHIECSTLTTLSFRIWNSSVAILSLPLTLFLVMLPKAHLTSHSRISNSRWVTMPLWLSESLRAFLYSYSLYSCHLFFISSASVRSILFLSFIVPILAWNVPLVSLIFLKISVVSHFIVFLYLLHWSLRKPFLSLLAVLWNSAFSWVYLSLSSLPFASLLFSAIFKAFSDNHLVFLHVFSLKMILVSTFCKKLQSFVQSSLGTLYVRSNPLNLFITSTV